MHNIWNSSQAITSFLYAAQWTVALAGILALTLTIRKNFLTAVAQNASNERIALANRQAAEAVQTTAIVRERAERLEHDNLALRHDLTAEVGKVAALQKDASNAKASQQKVELELAKQGTELAAQRQRAAVAERSLEELRNKLRPRVITSEQRAQLIAMLMPLPKRPIDIVSVSGDGEATEFANQIASILNDVGFKAGVAQALYGGGDPVGVGIVVKNAATAPPQAIRLQQAFFAIGIPMAGAENSNVAEGAIQIVVGHKPQ